MRWLVDARPLADAHAGGVPRVTQRLIDAFVRAAKDDEVVLATTGYNPASSFRLPASPNIRHIHLNIPNKIWSAACMTGTVSLDREFARRAGKIDAVFLPNIGFSGSIGTPYTLLLHDLSFLIEPRWFSQRMRLWHRAVRATSLIKNASHLLAVSEQTKRDAVRLLGIPEDRITVIPLGPTLDMSLQGGSPTTDAAILKRNVYFEGSPRRFAPRDDSRCALAFNGGPRKNVATAIEAVRALRENPAHADLELILIGPSVIPAQAGIHRWIPRSSRGMTRSSWIRSVSNPSDAELATLYKNAAAFLYPSWYEGYGLPLHEAAMLGTPCIASTAGALPETAPQGTLFADPSKPHHWVKALREALSSPRPSPIEPDPTAWDRAAEILKQSLTKL